MVAGIERISGLTSQNPLLTEWGNIPLPKAVIQDTGGQSFSGINFNLKPTFSTNFDPTRTFSSLLPTTQDSPPSLLGEDFAMQFSRHTSGMLFGNIHMRV